MNATDTTVERGTGNASADLDLPDADAHLLKAEPVSRIDLIVRERGIAQAEAARLLGLSQPACRGGCAGTSASTRWSACPAC